MSPPWEIPTGWQGISALRPAAQTRRELGRGDGATARFALPSGTVAIDVTIDGLAQPGSNHSISRGTGPSGADELVFEAAPTQGAVIEGFGFVR